MLALQIKDANGSVRSISVLNPRFSAKTSDRKFRFPVKISPELETGILEYHRNNQWNTGSLEHRNFNGTSEIYSELDSSIPV